MHGRSRAAHGIILLLSIVMVGASAAVGVMEARSYLMGGSSPGERFDVLAKGDFDGALSIASRTLVLKNCLGAMASLVALTQPTERRVAVNRKCLQVADRIVAEEPTNSLAWFVGAAAARELSDVDGFNKRLAEAQRTGPSEQWLAQMRVELAEENLKALPVDTLVGHDRDLVLLAQSQDGVASIARRYVRQPDFRSRITALVEQLPAEQQRRFLSYVQQTAQNWGGI